MHIYRAFWGSDVICAAEDVGFASLPVCGTAGEAAIAEVIANEVFGRGSVPMGCCSCYRMDAAGIALDLPSKRYWFCIFCAGCGPLADFETETSATSIWTHAEVGQKVFPLVSRKHCGASAEGQAEDSTDDLHGEPEPSELKPGVTSIDLRPIAASADRDERRKLESAAAWVR